MLKNIFAVFTILFFISSANALDEAAIKPEMTKKINEAVVILQNKDLTTKQKGEEIIAILDNVFDYKLMSRLTLGKKWKSLSSEEKNKFTTVFTKKLKSSYIDKLDLYTDQKIKILDLVKPKSTRAVLHSEIIGKDDVYHIEYKFYKNKKTSDWLIYDVDIVGVSLIQTYRKQFSGFLKDKSLEDLITNLNQNL